MALVLRNLVLLLQLSNLLRRFVSIHVDHIQVHKDDIEHLAFFEVIFDLLDSNSSVHAFHEVDVDLLQLVLDRSLDVRVVFNN